MSKLIKKLAFVFMVTLLTAVTTNIAFAEETTEPEKELALYNTDGDIDGDGVKDLWVGLRYVNEDNKLCIEVSYNGKPLTSLIEEGYKVEMMSFEEKQSSTGKISDWYDINEEEIITKTNTDLFIIDYFEGDYNAYQFRILGPDENLISMSDKFVLSPDIKFPVAISSNPYSYDGSYNFDSKGIKIKLKYNDNLILENTNKKTNIKMSLSGGLIFESYVDIPYFATNLSYDNHSETISIDGKDYTHDYCYVTFYCNFSNLKFDDIEYDSYSIRYLLTLENLIGKHSNTEPCYFFYDIYSYKDSSLNPKKKLTIKEHDNQLKVNDTVNLDVDIMSDEILKDNLIWVSSDENIAKVDENGVVTATGVGTAYIYATEDNTNELYDYCVVNVAGPVSKISLDVSTLALKTGESYKLIPTVEPETALDKTITWTSSNEKIATVDENGLVTTKSEGTVVITATSNYDSTISSTCHIIISNPIYKVTNIKIAGIPSKIKVGGNFKLVATVSPSNATNKKVTWKSSNTKYASVNSNGNVSIKSSGAGKTVKITATAKDDSGVTKTVTIKIPTIKVSKLKIKVSKTTVIAGKSVKATAYITPSNATNKKVTWKSSNTKYAAINSKGIIVTRKAGKGKSVKITATAKDNRRIKATITIKIK